MKNIKLLIVCLLLSAGIKAQVGIGTTSPNASAALDITSTTTGLLIPRVTAAQKSAIATPATGLMVYQTDGTAGFYYNGGTPGTPSWLSVGSSPGFLHVLTASGATTSITITDLSIRTVIADFNGGAGNAGGTVVNFTIPSAASYAAGTLITFEASGYTTSPTATFNFTSAGSTVSAVNVNNSSTVVSTVFTSISRFQVVTDGVSHWYRIL